jgi:hypothetical protein
MTQWSMKRLTMVAAMLAALAMQAAKAQNKKYDGPRPEKSDVVYIRHLKKLIETEVSEAKQSEEKNKTVYRVAGATSPARTPMAEPILLFRSEKINPDKLTLYKMTVEGGQRVLSFPNKRGKDTPRPIYTMLTPLDRGLFRIEVNEFIDDGEYCLSPEGSNAVFCFTTY